MRLSLAIVLTLISALESKNPIRDRIVGGELAPTDGFPYQVGLYITKNGTQQGIYWCGGALIYPDYVLTAAHCVYGGTESIAVFFGINNIASVPANDTTHVQASDITINSNFDPTLTSNDIALIRLSSNLTLNAAVQTIQLASSTMDQDFLLGKSVSTSGWGDTSATSTEITEELRYVNLTVISLTDCAAFFNSGLIQLTNICTSGAALSGPCNGDSGGPLTYRDSDGSLYLVGLTSFGNTAGCQSGYPNAYTRITSYLSWIANNTGYNAQSIRYSTQIDSN